MYEIPSRQCNSTYIFDDSPQIEEVQMRRFNVPTIYIELNNSLNGVKFDFMKASQNHLWYLDNIKFVLWN